MLQSVACYAAFWFVADAATSRQHQAGRRFVGLIKICQMQIMRININKLHANQQINMSHKTICGPMPATLIMLPLTRRLPCIASLSPFPVFPFSSAVNLPLSLSPKSRKCHKHRQQRVRRWVNIKKNRSRARAEWYHIGPQGVSGRGVAHLRQMQNNCIFIWAIGAASRSALPACSPLLLLLLLEFLLLLLLGVLLSECCCRKTININSHWGAF